MFTKRRFLNAMTALFAMGLTKPLMAQSQKDGFVHVVYFWLKEPGNDDHRSRFLRSLKSFLAEVDEINYYFVGEPAGTDRGVIDSSYTFSLVTTFDNRKNQDIYQEHASHKRFIAESESLWEKVVVYDSLPV